MIVHHHQSFILWSVLTLLTTTRPVQCDVSCVTGQFYVGGAGNVTCNFGENVRDTKHNFNIVLYTNPQDSGTYVLLCNWEKESLECNVKQNYRFDQATTPVTDSLVLEIPTVAESMAGLYVCQLVPDNGIPVHTCQLNVTDPPPTTPPPCTTSKPLTADQGTADQGQEGVIAGLIVVAVLLVLCIGYIVLLWYKFDLVKRGDRVEGSNPNPDGWEKHIYCCKCFPFKRPLGVANRDDPDCISNTGGERQPQPNSEITPLLIIENENYRNSVGSGVDEGACSGIDVRDYAIDNVGEVTVTVEVAPVSTLKGQQKPDAAAEDENPKKDLKLDTDANGVPSQNAPPGKDSNIVQTAATDETPPGELSDKSLVSESSNLNQKEEEKTPEKAPGDPMVSNPATLTRTPGSGDLPTVPERRVKSGSSPSRSTHFASPSPDGKGQVNKSMSLPYKPNTSIPVRPVEFSPKAGRTHRGQKPDDKSGPPEKETTTSGEHPPAAAQGPPSQSLSDSRNDDKNNDSQNTSPKSPPSSDNSSVDSTHKASENKKNEDTGNNGNADLFKKGGDNEKVGSESNSLAAAVPQQKAENDQKTEPPNPLQGELPDTTAGVSVAAAHPSTSSDTPDAEITNRTEGPNQPQEAKEVVETELQEGNGQEETHASSEPEPKYSIQQTPGVTPRKPESVTAHTAPFGSGKADASTVVPGTEDEPAAEDTASKNEKQDAEARSADGPGSVHDTETPQSNNEAPNPDANVQKQPTNTVGPEGTPSGQTNPNTNIKVDPTILPLPDEEYPPVDDTLPSQDTKGASQIDDHDVAAKSVSNLDDTNSNLHKEISNLGQNADDNLETSAGGKTVTDPQQTEQLDMDTSDTKQEGSEATKPDDSADTTQDNIGDINPNDSGATKPDDTEATKPDDSGHTNNDDSGDTNNDDNGDTEQDDSGNINPDHEGDTKQNDIEEASNDKDRNDEKTTDNSASITSHENQNAEKEENKDPTLPTGAEAESKQSPDTGSPESSDTSGTGGFLGWLPWRK